MTPDDWERLKQLFERALKLPARQRPVFINEIRLENQDLAARLAAMIEAHELETESIKQPVISDKNALFSSGELVLDRFRIVGLIGRGGMGEVYEADDLELGRVALKTVRAGIADNPQMLVRFKQEVQLARRVTSPQVCRIHELHVLPSQGSREPVLFLTMEFLEGITLARRIEHEGALPFQQARRVALQLCAALQAMHDAGLIHRDFKCNNVMLVPRGGTSNAVLMDLGLAREAAPATVESSITVPGAVMGTSEYMAPEQFEGRALTPATDIYSLGVVLYEMVTGIRPFRAPTPLAAAVRRARHLSPVSAIRADLPPHWDTVIERCLEYDSEKRYQAAGEVAAALIAIPRPAATTAPPRGRFLLRSRRIVIAAILAMAVGLAALLWRLIMVGPPPPLSPDARNRYQQGVSALREGSYLQAARLLGRAVELDNSFVLAHARLADAWSELDFTSKAQNEMLQVSGLEVVGRLPKIDKEYLDAVRATLAGQFTTAVQDYTAILRQLPPDEKGYGLVDLGRAYEKAGNIAAAQKDYAQAAKLAPENPAPFVRLGILESRAAGQSSEGEAAFAHAEALYRTSSNAEGIAEIAYQRGIAARLRGDYPEARTFLNESLHAASQMDSPQLQIRSLTQLCIVEYAVDNYAKAIELANTAIEKAHARELDIWATEALIRAGLVYIDKQDLAKAELAIQQGLRQAQDLRNGRLEALARLSLASLRDQQSGPPAERIALAQQAFDYYKTTGVFGQMSVALTLIVRALGDQADFPRALSDSLQLLDAAQKLGDSIHIIQAQESAGGLYVKLQRYPEALSHFKPALSTARATGQFVAYEASNCANVLWHLGRYSEARQTIESIPSAARTPREIVALLIRVSAGMALSQRRSKEALALTQHALKIVTLTPTETMELQIVSGIAQCDLGALRQAQQNCQSALAAARQAGDRYMTADASLCSARVYIAAGAPSEARPLAEAAQQFFAGSQQKESEWQSLLYLAQVCAKSNDPASAQKYAKKALDILSDLENNWGNPTYQVYVSRPDIHLARQQLSQLVQR